MQEKPVNKSPLKEISAPIEGIFMLTKDSEEEPLKVGDIVRKGGLIGYIESMKVYNAIMSEETGEVVEICPNNGDQVFEDDILVKIV